MYSTNMHKSSYVCNYCYAYIMIKTCYIWKFMCKYLNTLNFWYIPEHNGILRHHLSCMCKRKILFNISIHKFCVSPYKQHVEGKAVAQQEPSWSITSHSKLFCVHIKTIHSSHHWQPSWISQLPVSTVFLSLWIFD